MSSVSVSRSDLRRLVVAIDPAVSHDETSADTGIIVVARGPHQEATCRLAGATGSCPGHGYVLDDLTCHVAPHEWARRAVGAYDTWQADRLVAEVNNGGDMVGETIHAVRAGISYGTVRATRGKLTRAEPVAALYEQGRVHHLGYFAELESQLTTWMPGDASPDRLDALVWGITALGLVSGQGAAFLSAWRTQTAKAQTGSTTRRGAHPRSAPRQRTRCAHRWRGDHCVFCGEREEYEGAASGAVQTCAAPTGRG